MRTYACSFISGLGRVVADALKRACPDAEVRHLLDGLVVFDSDAGVNALKRLRFVNNLFAVLAKFDRRAIESMMRSVVDDPASVRLRRPSGKTHGKRVPGRS